ncbi:MAG TPA: MaoC family dehydratase [Candidatus Dormibacteraeota bacterium]|nr:MaoC family dehydratase [Candidatus Dormibacteraeota bacterium]
MSRIVLFDELKEHLGTEMVSDWFQIDQDRINAFADCTGDHQWIHVDPELAKKGMYGTTIAHGNLTLSLTLFPTSGMGVMVPVGSKMTLNYGYNKVRFLSPVKAGSRIRSHAVLKQVEDKGEGRILVTTEYTVEIEGQKKPALVAEILSMFLT